MSRYRKAVKNAPRDLKALSSLGLAYHESGNFKQAIIWYKKVQQLGTPAAVDMMQHMISALVVRTLFIPIRRPLYSNETTLSHP